MHDRLARPPGRGLRSLELRAQAGEHAGAARDRHRRNAARRLPRRAFESPRRVRAPRGGRHATAYRRGPARRARPHRDRRAPPPTRAATVTSPRRRRFQKSRGPSTSRARLRRLAPVRAVASPRPASCGRRGIPGHRRGPRPVSARAPSGQAPRLGGLAGPMRATRCPPASGRLPALAEGLIQISADEFAVTRNWASANSQ